MTRILHPDPSIAAWLADGPDALSPQRRAEVKSIARATAQRRLVVLPLPTTRGLRLVLAAAALGVLTIALAIGSGSLNLLTPPPEPTQTPALDVNAVPACWAEERSLSVPASGRLGVEGMPFSVSYSLPPGLELVGGAADGVIGFGTPYGLPHRVVGGGAEVFVPGSRGVVVADVTAAVRHGSLIAQPPIGTDARTFLEDLDSPVAYGDGTIDFEVDEVTQTEVGGRPAWTARVRVPELDPPMWSHIDRRPPGKRDCAVEFGMPNRVWVLDVGSSIVLVQAWAADEEGLVAWLPEATRLFETFRFSTEGVVEPPAQSAGARAGSASILRPWVALTIDYVLPDGLDLYTDPTRAGPPMRRTSSSSCSGKASAA